MGLCRALLLVVALTLCDAAVRAQDARPPSEALLRLGLVALQQRDTPAAQEYLEQVLDRDPAEPRAWVGLAQVYRILNLHGQARRHASEAERHGKDDPLIQHALSMFHADYGNWGEAARWEEEFARGGRGGLEAYVRAVSLYMQADMPIKAAEVGREALELGESAALHNLLGKAYAMSDQPEAGLRHLELAVKAEPYNETMHYDLGHFHLRQLDYDSARKAFLSGTKYFDKSPAIEIGLGIAAYGQRRFGEAIEHFLRTAELAPTMEQPHAFLGRLLQHGSDRLDLIEERLKIYHERHSKNHFGPFLYGQVLLAKLGTGTAPETITAIEALLNESIERNDNFWESHYELGVLLEKKRDFKNAEKHFKRAVDLNPHASKPHYRLARVYQRLGKTTAAKKERALHAEIAEQERRAMQAKRLPRDLATSVGLSSR